MRQPACEVYARSARVTGAMNLKRPSRLLGTPNELAGLLIRRRLLGEVVDLGIDAPEAKGRRYAAVARAGRIIRHEATVRARKHFDRRAGVLQTLAEQLRRDPKRLGGLGA